MGNEEQSAGTPVPNVRPTDVLTDSTQNIASIIEAKPEHSFSPITCPECESRRFVVIPPQSTADPVKAKCVELDCGCIYKLTDAQIAKIDKNGVSEPSTPANPLETPTLPRSTNSLGNKEQKTEQNEAKTNEKKNKDTKETKGKRSYKGSKIDALMQLADKNGGLIPLVANPPKGVGEQVTDSLIYDGADALIKAHHDAAKLAKRYGEEFEAKWLLKTSWLNEQGERDYRGRARANYALKWRPMYLAALALTNSPLIACRTAGIGRTTAFNHRRDDPEFDAQCKAAEEHAIQLLHDRCWQSAVEGDLEPIVWQGLIVGYIRNYDSKLRLEFLRAYLPDKFKTPGQTQINIGGDHRKVIVYSPERAADIHRRRHEALVKAKELEGVRSDESTIDIDSIIKQSV